LTSLAVVLRIGAGVLPLPILYVDLFGHFRDCCLLCRHL